MHIKLCTYMVFGVCLNKTVKKKKTLKHLHLTWDKEDALPAREAKQGLGTQRASKSSQIAASYFSGSYFYPYIFHIKKLDETMTSIHTVIQ